MSDNQTAQKPAETPSESADSVAEVKAKSLRLVTYGLFVIAVLSWVISFTVLFVFMIYFETFGDTWAAMGKALGPSLVICAICSVLCVIAYFIYRKLILKV